MRHTAPRKEFSVERMMRHGRGAASAGDAPPSATDTPRMDDDTGYILIEMLTDMKEEMAEMRAEMHELRANASEMQAAQSDAASSVDTGADEMAKDVRIEIAQMVRVIAKTKAEIAQIKHPLSTGDQLETTHSELDAIVKATEGATQDILEASERLEAHLSSVAALASEDQEIIETVDAANDQITQIMEACNFQDITGQRITKVVKTVRFIEDRILAMISIWGADAFQDLPIEAGDENAEHGDEALLQGPQLGNEGISQAEIDALFD